MYDFSNRSLPNFAATPTLADKVPGQPLLDIRQNVCDEHAGALKSWFSVANERVHYYVMAQFDPLFPALHRFGIYVAISCTSSAFDPEK
jgi:hypothetical protein